MAESQNLAKNTLLQVNDLTYVFPKNLSVVERRVLIRSNFAKSSYDSTEVANCELNSGDYLIGGKNSYFYGKLTVTSAGGTGTWDVSNWGLASLIASIAIKAPSGEELERVDNPGHIRAIEDRYRHGADWFTSNGSLSRYGATGTSAQVVDFCIPMGALLGCFRTDALLPSQGWAGAQIEIRFNTVALAFKTLTLADLSYTITNPSIVCDCYTPTPGIKAQLNTMSASRGLEVYFDSFDHSQAKSTGAGSLSMQARKTMGRAMYVVVQSRNDSNLLGTAGTDPTISSPQTVDATSGAVTAGIGSYLFNLGGLFFPNQPVNTNTEMVQNALYVYGKHQEEAHPGSVGLTEFGTNAIACASLERSSLLALSGLPVGTGRILNLDITLVGATPRTHDMFVNYVKVARCYLNRVKVIE